MLRQISIALPLILSAVLCLPAPSTAWAEKVSQADVPHDLNLPAGALSKALDKLGDQSGIQIIFEASLVEGVKVSALTGNFSVRAALTQLLANTGLKADSANDKTVVLKRVAPSTSGLSPADQMRLAMAADKDKQTADAQKEEKDEDDTRQVVVKDKKVKPYSDANVDLPRTINDERPYYIFDSETIERSAALNLEDFLKQRLTMNMSVQTGAQVGSASYLDFNLPQKLAGNGNTSKINLRGLGNEQTLILVNGRRRAGVFTGQNEDLQQTNINGIPMSAVERIEVLPSSASGIYGGSAMGGVINIILKKNYQGGNLQVSYDTPADTDAPRRTVAGRYGFSLEGGRTSLTFSASLTDSKGMYLRDRLDLYLKNRDTVLKNDPSQALNAYTPYATSLFPIARLGATVNIVGLNASFQLGNLILKSNSTSLGSPYTHLSPGVSSSTSSGELDTILRNNAGGYDLTMPPTGQVGGLLKPLDADTEVRGFQVGVERQMLSWLDAYAEFSRSQNIGTGSGFGRSQVGGYFSQLYVPSSVTASPFANNVIIAVPVAPDGNPEHDRNYRSEYTTTQAVAGLKLRLPWDWTAQLDYQRSENEQDASYMDVELAELQRRVRASELNVFVDTLQNPLQFDDLWYPVRVHGKGITLSTAALRGAGNAFPLPWGMARLAVGLEHNSTQIPAQTVERKLTFNPMGGGNSGAGDYTYHYYPRNQAVDSLYTELEIPLVASDRHPWLHSLSLQLTGRVDRSEVDAGTQAIYYEGTSPNTPRYVGKTENGQPYFSRESYESNNYTLGMKYQPAPWLTLRASSATAFLPPTPRELQRLPSDEIIITYDDPIKGMTPNIRYIVSSAGNPDLKPQNARSLNAGFILEPTLPALKGLRLNLEYYSIKQFDVIGDYTLGLSGLSLQQYEQDRPERVHRDSNGFLTLIDYSLANLFERDTAGVDMSLGYDLDTSRGHFNLQVMHTTVLRLKTQYQPYQPAVDAAGYAPLEGGGPKHKSNATFTWSRNAWNVNWAVTSIGSYKQYGVAGGPTSVRSYNGAVNPLGQVKAQGGNATIASQAYHDLSVGYSFTSQGGSYPGWLQGTDITAGIKNVFDRAPAFDAYYTENFYASPFGDLRLRSYWLSLRRTF